MKNKLKIMQSMLKISFFLMLIIAGLSMLHSVDYAPPRRAVVVGISVTYDAVQFDSGIFLVKKSQPHRRLHSIVSCRRKFEIGLFSSKELEPECGV